MLQLRKWPRILSTHMRSTVSAGTERPPSTASRRPPRIWFVIWVLLGLASGACGDVVLQTSGVEDGAKRDGFVGPDYGAKDFGPFKHDRRHDQRGEEDWQVPQISPGERG